VRACGGCTLCCKLIPVEELGKKAGQRCINCNTGKGCRIYATRPWSCREWSCLWIKGTEDGTELQLRRPDRSHYVIDEVPDIVRITNNETGEVTQIDVMQIWVDPSHPMAAEDDAELKAMLERQGIIALVRFSSQRGYTLWPPSRTPDGEWHRSETQSADDLRDAQREARFRFWSEAAKRQA
jgi:Fe-S-cluster containining protein